MRRCSNCKVEKHEESFYPHVSSHRTECIGCMKKRYLIKKRILGLIKMLDGCAKCGESRHPAILCFHHVRGKKKFTIGEAPRSWKALLEEIQKCEILCSNCHALRHAEDNEWRSL